MSFLLTVERYKQGGRAGQNDESEHYHCSISPESERYISNLLRSDMIVDWV